MSYKINISIHYIIYIYIITYMQAEAKAVVVAVPRDGLQHLVDPGVHTVRDSGVMCTNQYQYMITTIIVIITIICFDHYY